VFFTLDVLHVVLDILDLFFFAAAQRTTRDVEYEETIENQQDSIRKLSRDNEILKQKVRFVLKQKK